MQSNNSTVFNDPVSAEAEWRALQPFWDLILRNSYYTSSPGFPVIMYFIAYILMQIPCTILDLCSVRYKWLCKYKIQPDTTTDWMFLQPAILGTFWNHLLYVLPSSMAQWAWLPDTELPVVAPTVWQFCWHQYASLALVDFQYYLWHVLHHKVRFLYKHIHSFHHQYSAVNSWVTQYSHPWELFSLGFFTTTSPWVFGAHPLTQWSFLIFMLAVSVEDHCGYDLPLMPHRWAPFWGGSLKHDMHHQRPLTNFQPFFNWFDRLFGSEWPPNNQDRKSVV